MAIDYVTGLIVAGVFKKSIQENRYWKLKESKAGWKGLVSKHDAPYNFSRCAA